MQRGGRSWPTPGRATLGTIGPDGTPRLVPICFVLDPDAPVLVYADRREAEADRRPLIARPRPRHRGATRGRGPRRPLGRGLDETGLGPLPRAGGHRRSRGSPATPTPSTRSAPSIRSTPIIGSRNARSSGSRSIGSRAGARSTTRRGRASGSSGPGLPRCRRRWRRAAAATRPRPRDRRVERVRVPRGGGAIAADLADVLAGGGLQFARRGRGVGPTKGLDASAHARTVPRVRGRRVSWSAMDRTDLRP